MKHSRSGEGKIDEKHRLDLGYIKVAHTTQVDLIVKGGPHPHDFHFVLAGSKTDTRQEALGEQTAIKQVTLQ